MSDTIDKRFLRKSELIRLALEEADRMDKEQGLIGGHVGGLKSKTNPMRQQVIEFLRNLELMTPVTLQDLYSHLGITGNSRSTAAVRAALYGISVGCKVSERSVPSEYFAIKIPLDGKEVFLSLPGIPSVDLKNDIVSEKKREDIISSFKNKYGHETIKYWAQSAQYRSVSIAATGMRAAKKRDGYFCKICRYLGNKSHHPVSACHLVSRKSLFWETLEIVEKLKGSIFTEEAVIELKKRLSERELHSGTNFIVTLCKEHDDLVQSVLGESIIKSTVVAESPLLD